MRTFVQPTIQSWTKFETFFLARLNPRTPGSMMRQRHRGTQDTGGHIIEPGVRGFIIELGVRGMGENREMVALKKFQTFVQHGRKEG